MIDSTYVKAHHDSCDARRGNQAIPKTKGCLKHNRLHHRGYKGFKEKRQQSHLTLYCSHHIIENTCPSSKR